ncbi:MAG: radical SAM family heme chaperone HemW [Firmicutes bacterium]|nr:radical SAM family heme chaperone HemW [Bacillota bacterium]
MDRPNMMLYIHIPFCVRKCLYCDFLSFPGCAKDTISAYAQALVLEMQKKKHLADGHHVSSIFFGGGTPSLIDTSLMGRIMETIHRLFDVDPDAEITMEMNPGTVTAEKAACYKALGINRISMGAQSFVDKELSSLGRIHQSDQTAESVRILKEEGFDNISLDLMFDLPYQSLDSWMYSLQKALGLGLKHLSCYSLIVEEGTEFNRLYEEGKLNLPGEDLDRAMYHGAKAYLEKQGFRQYEISNFALEGFHSRHNLGYWTRELYLGFGLGAASLEPGQIRSSNTCDLDAYLKDPAAGMEREALSLEDQMSETMFLGLRTLQGVDLERFEKTYQQSARELFADAIDRHMADGLLALHGKWLHLTEKGLDLANQVYVDFLL